MKTIFSLLFSLMFATVAIAQNSNLIPKQANQTNFPIEFKSGVRDFNEAFNKRLLSTDKEFKNPVIRKVKYSTPQLERLTYLLKNDILPEGLKGDQLDKNLFYIPYYKAYWVGNITSDGKWYSIIYIPKDENQHMPKDLIPPTDEGIFLSVYIYAQKFRNRTLAGTKPPSEESRGKSVADNVHYSSVPLSRWERTKGIFILWYGTTSFIQNYKAVAVDFDNSFSEESVIADLKKKYTDNYYVGYSFKEGYTCADVYSEIAQKMNVSIKDAQDLRLGSCSDYVIKYNK